MLKFFVGINISSVKSDKFFCQVRKIITDGKLIPTKMITNEVFTSKVVFVRNLILPFPSRPRRKYV